MVFLQWLTIGFTAFIFLLVITYWMGWSRPGPGTDYRKDILTALVGIEGLLLGAFIQEFRVQEKEQVARQVVEHFDSVTAKLERTTPRSSSARPTVDTLRQSITSIKRLDPALFRRPNLRRSPR